MKYVVEIPVDAGALPGFPLPAHVPVSFVTPQFLSVSIRQSSWIPPSLTAQKSFFPTLLVIPLVILWNLTDWMLKWYQVRYPSLSYHFVS
jgi:hypothetical protein